MGGGLTPAEVRILPPPLVYHRLKSYPRGFTETPRETVRKELRARSRRKFGQGREGEMGKKVPLGRFMGLGCRPVRDFSDSFRGSLLGNRASGLRVFSETNP